LLRDFQARNFHADFAWLQTLHHKLNCYFRDIICGGRRRLLDCKQQPHWIWKGFRFLLSLDELSDNLDELMDLCLSLMSNLFNTGMLTLHGGDHRLQLLLHELSFDVTNLLFLVVNMEGFPHLGVLCVDDS
jgi:hypothetical protein